MRADIDMERGGELHERVKAYADKHSIRHSRAYAELLERGLDAAESTNSTSTADGAQNAE